jgi:hypothetical protein
LADGGPKGDQFAGLFQNEFWGKAFQTSVRVCALACSPLKAMRMINASDVNNVKRRNNDMEFALKKTSCGPARTAIDPNNSLLGD